MQTDSRFMVAVFKLHFNQEANVVGAKIGSEIRQVGKTTTRKRMRVGVLTLKKHLETH